MTKAVGETAVSVNVLTDAQLAGLTGGQSVAHTGSAALVIILLWAAGLVPSLNVTPSVAVAASVLIGTGVTYLMNRSKSK